MKELSDSCLIVARKYVKHLIICCDKVKYFSYHFLKKVSEDFILSRWKYFYFDFLGWKKKMFDENIFVAEMLNEISVKYTILQLVGIVCRDNRYWIIIKHYYTLCKCYTLWLIANKARNLIINFADVCEVKQWINNMFTKLT